MSKNPFATSVKLQVASHLNLKPIYHKCIKIKYLVKSTQKWENWFKQKLSPSFTISQRRHSKHFIIEHRKEFMGIHLTVESQMRRKFVYHNWAQECSRQSSVSSCTGWHASCSSLPWPTWRWHQLVKDISTAFLLDSDSIGTMNRKVTWSRTVGCWRTGIFRLYFRITFNM
jgi:hypothetical protein